MMGDDSKQESCRESLNILRGYLSNLEEDVGRNMDSKVHSEEFSECNEEMNKLLETGGKIFLMKKWQMSWLNCVCVPIFCGR